MYPISVIHHLLEIGATTTDIYAACTEYQVVFINLSSTANTLQVLPDFADSPLNYVNSQRTLALLDIAFKLGIFANEKRSLTVNTYKVVNVYYKNNNFSSCSEIQLKLGKTSGGENCFTV
jgi:hypothetical protein